MNFVGALRMTFGGISEPCSLASRMRGAIGAIGGIRFRRGGDIDHRLASASSPSGEPRKS